MEEEQYWLIGRSDIYWSHYTALKCNGGEQPKIFNVWLSNGGGEHMYVKTKQEAIDILASQVREEIKYLQNRLSQILNGDIEE